MKDCFAAILLAKYWFRGSFEDSTFGVFKGVWTGREGSNVEFEKRKLANDVFQMHKKSHYKSTVNSLGFSSTAVVKPTE